MCVHLEASYFFKTALTDSGEPDVWSLSNDKILTSIWQCNILYVGLTDSGESDVHRGFLADVLEDLRFGVAGDVMGHLKVAKCSC